MWSQKDETGRQMTRTRNLTYPFRDKQRDGPRFVCLNCGQEQYTYDPLPEAGLCLSCRQRARKREEDAMTLQEMSVEYRAQAQVLRGRIKELQEARRGAQDPAEQEKLQVRIWALDPLWREARDQAVLLERYYERGYRRNARYTL